jgi:WD40 repeat protein
MEFPVPPEPKKSPPKPSPPIAVDQQLCCIRWSPDGKLLAAGSFEGVVRRWGTSGASFTELPALKGHNGWVQAIAFAPDGKQLFSADSWGRLSAWSVADIDAKPTWSIPAAHDGWIHALAVSPDGKQMATAGRDRVIRITAAADGKKVHTLTAGEDVLALAYHPDGKSVVSGDLKGTIKQWNVADGKMIREFDAKVMFLRDRIQDVGGVRCFAFTADGSTLFAGGSQPKTGAFVQAIPLILAFDSKTGSSKEIFRGANDNEGIVLDLHWHPDGFVMAVHSGQPGQGKFFCKRPSDAQPHFAQALPNPHSFAFHGQRVIVSATNANSSGNGRVGGKGEYPGNYSPLHVLELPS